MSGFAFLVKNSFPWIMISTKQRFKKNKIGSWRASIKLVLSHETIKIPSRKAISAALTKQQEILSILANTENSSENAFLY